MFKYFETVATIAIIFLANVPYSQADFQQFTVTFIERKTVSTCYKTIEPFSEVQCAEKCYAEGQQGRCTIAGYNKATQSCRLSMDSQQDVVNSQDEWDSVFIYQQELIFTTQGIWETSMKTLFLSDISILTALS